MKKLIVQVYNKKTRNFKNKSKKKIQEFLNQIKKKFFMIIN